MGTNRVVLMGGLGNQLFQYAFATRLHEETGTNVILDSKFLAIRLDNEGTPDLERFHQNDQVSIESERTYPQTIRRLIGFSLRKHLEQSNKFDQIICGLIRICSNILLTSIYRSPTRIVICDDNGYVPVKFNSRNDLYVGYFQSYKYGEAPITSLKYSLKPTIVDSEKFKKYMKLAQSENPLAVHIRLTDYRNEPNFGIPSSDYYYKSILFHFSQHKYGSIWLFSDEPENAIEYIPEQFRSLVRNVSEEISDSVDTFEVMRLAKGYVIANSSYSWWAARASHNSDPIVTYPDPWFKQMPTPLALCPPNWHPIAR